MKVFLDKGINTTFAYTTTNNATQIYVCCPNSTANLWLINCFTSAPELNTILYRTSTYLKQISMGTSTNTAYNQLLTFSNPTSAPSAHWTYRPAML